MLLCRTGRLLIHNCRCFLDIENTGHASQSRPPLKAYKLQQGVLPSSLMTCCTTRLAGKQTESHLDVLEITWYHISARTSNVLTCPALLLCFATCTNKIDRCGEVYIASSRRGCAWTAILLVQEGRGSALCSLIFAAFLTGRRGYSSESATEVCLFFG
jgi:hypothetical protein